MFDVEVRKSDAVVLELGKRKSLCATFASFEAERYLLANRVTGSKRGEVLIPEACGKLIESSASVNQTVNHRIHIFSPEEARRMYTKYV